MNHKEMYTERIEIRVTKKQRKLLEKIFKEEGMTFNQTIRDLIDSYCI